MIHELKKWSVTRLVPCGQRRIRRNLVVKDNEDHVVNYNYRATLSPPCVSTRSVTVINSNPDTRYPLLPLFFASKLALQLPILPIFITQHLYIYIYISSISDSRSKPWSRFYPRDNSLKTFHRYLLYIRSRTNFHSLSLKRLRFRLKILRQSHWITGRDLVSILSSIIKLFETMLN